MKYKTLIDILKRQDKKVNFVIIGNSLSAGYSIIEDTIPYLYRNQEFIKELDSNNIFYSIYHFATPRNNENSAILFNLIKEINIKDINTKVDNDIKFFNNELNWSGINRDKLSKYYDINETENKSVREILEDNNAINIIILNCCTGGCLALFNRGNKLEKALFLKGIFKDLRDYNFILMYLYYINKNSLLFINSIPNITFPLYRILNLAIDMINFKIKQISNRYCNTIFIKQPRIKGFYKSNKQIDFHPNNKEYEMLVKNTTINLSNNIEELLLLQDLNSFMFKHLEVNLKNIENLNNKTLINKEVKIILEKYDQKINNKGLKRYVKYFNKVYPYQFVGLDRNLITIILKENIKK